ncbi:MAG: hypothetical protein ACPGWR_06315, partial [Ardenticatenaceae bacterium]
PNPLSLLAERMTNPKKRTTDQQQDADCAPIFLARLLIRVFLLIRGSFVSRSLTNSMAIITPRPRTSPTTSYFVPYCTSFTIQMPPAARIRSKVPSDSSIIAKISFLTYTIYSTPFTAKDQVCDSPKK